MDTKKIMEAIEFRSTVTNGVIKVPEQYHDRLTTEVRVILLTQEKPRITGMIATLLEHPLEVKGFTSLSREDIYEIR